MRELSGVPRRQRPQSAAVRAATTISADAFFFRASSNDGSGSDGGVEGGLLRNIGRTQSVWQAASASVLNSSQGPRGRNLRPASSFMQGEVEEEALEGGGGPMGGHSTATTSGIGGGPRPQSAPSRRLSSGFPGRSPSSSFFVQQQQQQQAPVSATKAIGGAIPRRPLSARGGSSVASPAASSGRAAKPYLATPRPPGDHWGALLAAASPSSASRGSKP